MISSDRRRSPFEREETGPTGMENMIRSLFGSCLPVSPEISHRHRSSRSRSYSVGRQRDNPVTGMIIEAGPGKQLFRDGNNTSNSSSNSRNNSNRQKKAGRSPQEERRRPNEGPLPTNPYPSLAVVKRDDDAMSAITSLTLEEMDIMTKMRKKANSRMADQLIVQARQQRHQQRKSGDNSDTIWDDEDVLLSSRFEPKLVSRANSRRDHYVSSENPMFSHSSPLMEDYNYHVGSPPPPPPPPKKSSTHNHHRSQSSSSGGNMLLQPSKKDTKRSSRQPRMVTPPESPESVQDLDDTSNPSKSKSSTSSSERRRARRDSKGGSGNGSRRSHHESHSKSSGGSGSRDTNTPSRSAKNRSRSKSRVRSERKRVSQRSLHDDFGDFDPFGSKSTIKMYDGTDRKSVV